MMMHSAVTQAKTYRAEKAIDGRRKADAIHPESCRMSWRATPL